MCLPLFSSCWCLRKFAMSISVLQSWLFQSFSQKLVF